MSLNLFAGGECEILRELENYKNVTQGVSKYCWKNGTIDSFNTVATNLQLLM